MSAPASIDAPLLNAPRGRSRGGGGMAARRAVSRWAWRLFRREWRQQLLVLAMVTVAVATTILGSAVATNNPAPASAGFGTAQDAATFSGADSHLSAQIASLRHRFGRVDVIADETFPIPGSVGTYELRAQDPDGASG
jgi:putative ABC transport system permease protein